MKIHNKRPCTNGFRPVDTTISRVRLAPIINRVIFNPVFEASTINGERVCIAGIVELRIVAPTKKRINHGIFIFLLSLLKRKTVNSERGIIQRALTSLMVVAVCRASFPYLLAAPTTELVS